MPSKRVILAGGSGFIGRALASRLARQGYEPVILTRGAGGVAWDGRTLGPWAELVDGAAGLVNLTGRSVNCRYTPANRAEILASRLDSVRVLAEAVRRAKTPPPAWVQAGSLAIYGDVNDRDCDESAPTTGEGFGAEVCRQWEAAFFAEKLPASMRRSVLRIGFVLGRDGGALGPLVRLTKCFLGGQVSHGRQVISWLHEDDLNQMIERGLFDAATHGVYNATGPTPVTNAEFMRALRRTLRRPWAPPTPALAVRFGARFILRTEAELALTGRRCVPARFLAAGFTFAHPALSEALRVILE